MVDERGRAVVDRTGELCTLATSLTSQLIDFMLTTHPAYPQLVELAKEQSKSTYELLGDRLEELRVAKGAKTLSE